MRRLKHSEQPLIGAAIFVLVLAVDAVLQLRHGL